MASDRQRLQLRCHPDGLGATGRGQLEPDVAPHHREGAFNLSLGHGWSGIQCRSSFQTCYLCSSLRGDSQFLSRNVACKCRILRYCDNYRILYRLQIHKVALCDNRIIYLHHVHDTHTQINLGIRLVLWAYTLSHIRFMVPSDWDKLVSASFMTIALIYEDVFMYKSYNICDTVNNNWSVTGGNMGTGRAGNWGRGLCAQVCSIDGDNNKLDGNLLIWRYTQFHFVM